MLWDVPKATAHADPSFLPTAHLQAAAPAAFTPSGPLQPAPGQPRSSSPPGDDTHSSPPSIALSPSPPLPSPSGTHAGSYPTYQLVQFPSTLSRTLTFFAHLGTNIKERHSFNFERLISQDILSDSQIRGQYKYNHFNCLIVNVSDPKSKKLLE